MLKCIEELDPLNLPTDVFAVFYSESVAVKGFHVNQDVDRRFYCFMRNRW